jgi:hypothetical protein
MLTHLQPLQIHGLRYEQISFGTSVTMQPEGTTCVKREAKYLIAFAAKWRSL